MPYLDIIYRLRVATHLPIVAYHVSGEYAMLKAAAEKVCVMFIHVYVYTYLYISMYCIHVIRYAYARYLYILNTYMHTSLSLN